MCRKLICLISFVGVLAMSGIAPAGLDLPVDMVRAIPGADPPAAVPETWDANYIPFIRWTDIEPHDAGTLMNAGGSGINIGLGAGAGDSMTKLVYSTTPPVPQGMICNTYLIHKYEGDDGTHIHLVLWGEGLLAGVQQPGRVAATRQGPNQRSGLHEVRPGPNNDQDLHRPRIWRMAQPGARATTACR